VQKTINLSASEFKIIRQILEQYVSDCKVFAFGSRLNNRAKKYSDLDIAIIGSKKLSLRTLGALRDAFAESNLPFRVDIVDWHTVSKEFRQIIEKDYVQV